MKFLSYLLLSLSITTPVLAGTASYSLINDSTNDCEHISQIDVSKGDSGSFLHFKSTIDIPSCRFFGIDQDLPISNVSSTGILFKDKPKSYIDGITVQRKIKILTDGKIKFEVWFEEKMQSSCFFKKTK